MPQAFTLFPQLPPELRLKIWTYLLPPPTTLSLTLPSHPSLTFPLTLRIPRKPPVLLHISHETRELAQSKLTAVLSPPTYIDLAQDTLYIPPTTGRAITSRSSLESLLRDAGSEDGDRCRGGSAILARLQNLAVHLDNWDNLIEVAPGELVELVFSGLRRVVVVVNVMDRAWMVDKRRRRVNREGDIDLMPLRGDPEHIGFVRAYVEESLEGVQGVEVVLMSGKKRGL